MENLIDTSFDKDLSNIGELTWLPWIGDNYKNNAKRLLIVGESAYLGDEHYKGNDEEYQNLFFKSTENKLTIRQNIEDYQIRAWKEKNRTLESIPKVILGTNIVDKELFWKQVCYYNFIQRLMNYRINERPKPIEYYNSWKTFIELVKFLNPTDCVFIGVEASWSFKKAMDDSRINESQINWLEKIGRTSARIALLKINKNETKLSFIEHVSCKGFSWRKWNVFLERENNEILRTIKMNF